MFQKKPVFKISTVLFILLTVCSLLSCNGSSSDDKTSKSISGFIVDILTGEKITDGSFTISLDTVHKTYKGSYSAKTGRYTVSGLPDKYFNFVLTVQDANEAYHKFTVTDDFMPYGSASTGSDIKINYAFMRNIPLVPVTLKTPEMSLKIVDAYSGVIVGDGAYKLMRSSAAIETLNQSDTTSSTDAESLLFAQDALPISGTFTNGTLTLAAGTLLYGYSYTIQIFNVAGYMVKESTLNSLYSSYNGTTGQSISLTPLNRYAAPSIIGISNYNSQWIPSSTRVITITFNQNVEVDTTGIRGIGSNTLLSVSAPDNDADGNPTPTMTVETVAATAVSSNVTVAAIGNTMTITIAADTSLLTGTIDTNDDLMYTFSVANFQNLVEVRGTAYDSMSWTTLSSLLSSYVGSSNLYYIVRDAY